ncbi:MAG TPA: hypothetical protein VJH92_02280 [Candidatus Nanoarchaeia archaeon]|nr:hypothetical protein [Candidatus Nanoarchaeia archaeon]
MDIKKVVYLWKDETRYASYSAKYFEDDELKEWYKEEIRPYGEGKCLYSKVGTWFFDGEGEEEFDLGRTISPHGKEAKLYEHVKKAAEAMGKRRNCLFEDCTRYVSNSKKNKRIKKKGNFR